MKQYLLSLLFFLFCANGFSQVEDGVQLRGTLIHLGLSSEFKLADQISIGVNGGLLPSFSYTSYRSSSGNRSSESDFSLNPMANATARYYYNFNTRDEKGKKTSGNSANYVGISYLAIGEALSQEEDVDDYSKYNASGVVWGLQRTYDSNIYLDLNLGLGVVTEKNSRLNSENSDLSAIGNFTLGYSFLR